MNAVDLGMSWLALREEGHPLPGDIRVSGGPFSPGAFELMLGVDSDNHRHILISAPPGEDQPTFNSAGVRILSRMLEDHGRSRNFVDVICLRPDLNDLFDILVLEIVTALESNSADPASLCRSILARWQDLLAEEPSALLGLDALTGLFGELHFLLRILRLN